jgi:hypothetical protein
MLPAGWSSPPKRQCMKGLFNRSGPGVIVASTYLLDDPFVCGIDRTLHRTVNEALLGDDAFLGLKEVVVGTHP